jgi:hypothetical protein
MVNHYGFHLYYHHWERLDSAPRADGLIVGDLILKPVPELTEYTDIDNNNMGWLAFKMTGHASQHNAEHRKLWCCPLAHSGLMALQILRKVVTNASTNSRKSDCESCILWQIA